MLCGCFATLKGNSQHEAPHPDLLYNSSWILHVMQWMIKMVVTGNLGSQWKFLNHFDSETNLIIECPLVHKTLMLSHFINCRWPQKPPRAYKWSHPWQLEAWRKNSFSEHHRWHLRFFSIVTKVNSDCLEIIMSSNSPSVWMAHTSCDIHSCDLRSFPSFTCIAFCFVDPILRAAQKVPCELCGLSSATELQFFTSAPWFPL